MITDYRKVIITGGFWKEKENLNKNVTIGAVYDRFNESGRVEAFKFNWKPGMDHQPHIFWDSDIAKWLESAAYALSRDENPELEAKVEEIIDDIIEHQGDDGYFNIYYTVVEPGKRWTDRNCHELYCAGHLMEAAVAYYNATGRDRFLKAMEKYADYIAQVFTVEHSAAFSTPGHEEIELALYKMFKLTGKTKFFDLMKYFLETRGLPGEQSPFNPKQVQAHLHIRDQHVALGHSVRAMYLYSGMADYAAETGDKEVLAACRDLFEDVTNRKMYITGGIGSTNIGEAFTIPYDLPNAHAYTETCASLGLMFFANRMLKADRERSSKYADAVELEMYNGALSGLSLDGDKFFYENPLEIDVDARNRLTATDGGERWPISQRVKIFGCSCCPPNITRVLASLGEYFYAYDECDGIMYVNQFGESEYEDGEVKVSQKTCYPFDGKVEITSTVPVKVRIPGWCRKFTADSAYCMQNGYACFGAGTVCVEFEIKPELVSAHPYVVNDLGKAALRRGPVIYCAEGVDNGRVQRLAFDSAAIGSAVLENDPSGLPAITVDGFEYVDRKELYAPIGQEFRSRKIRLIPYYSFANRGETDMLVFMPYR